MKPNKTHLQRLALAGLTVACWSAFCLSLAAANYTSTTSVGAGNNWNGNYWIPPGGGALTGPPTPGNTYELTTVSGQTLTSGGDPRTRDPAWTTAPGPGPYVVTFPGDTLILDLNTDIRLKGPGTTLNFPGPGGLQPGLVLRNGAGINIGDDGQFWIDGIIFVYGTNYIFPATSGTTADARAVNITGVLVGDSSSTVVYLNGGMMFPQEISGNNNSYNGQWVLREGWLLASGNGSLGTNSITVDPNWAVPSVIGAFAFGYTKALLDISYPINSAGTLTLANGGQLALHQNLTFAGVVINGTSLAAGTYTYAQLVAAYPAYFTSGGWGTITVQPYGTPPTESVPTPGVEQWISADVGGPAYAGSVITNADGTLDVLGGGSDIWNTSSQFHYYYAWALGQQWDISVQLKAFVGPDQWSKVELLVDNANPVTGPQGSDPFIAMMDTQPSWVTAPDGGTGVAQGGIDQWRTAGNGNSDWKQAGNTPRPDYPDDWIRINRNGSVFTLYKSPDGYTWNQYIAIDTASSSLIGQDNATHFGTAWPNLVAVGVAVTAHNNGTANLGDATIANLQATFPQAQAPTLIKAQQNTPAILANAYACEASLTFVATNNAFPAPALVSVNYQWYKNGTAISGATSTSLTWLLDSSDNNAAYYCSATCAAPFTALTINSATTMVSVLPATYYTNGLKVEFFSTTVGRLQVETGNVAAANSIFTLPNLDSPGNYGNNYVTRVSGWFIPPTSDSYTFYVAADDDTDLFLSTDATKANKVLIAQETAWSPTDVWLGDQGAGNAQQMCSDTFANNGLVTYPNGIPLIAGQPYYIEQVHSQGGGGDNFGATYITATQKAVAPITDGVPSMLQATNNNIMFATLLATTNWWVTQPTNTIATLGLAATFYSKAASDGELPDNYQWYLGVPGSGTPIAGATSANYSIPVTASGNNGQSFFSVATTFGGGISITSTVATLNVAAPVTEPGWAKMEYWYNPNPGIGSFRNLVTNTTTGDVATYLKNTYSTPANYTIFEPRFEGNSAANAPANFTSRLTAMFYPPTTGLYQFYVNSDDPGDLYVSTNSTPNGAQLVAQETGWSGSWQWTGGNGGSTAQQKCSATWQDPAGISPWSAGIQLTAGQPYYVSLIHQDTGGGNNCEATYTLFGVAAPANGTVSAMSGNLITTVVPRAFHINFTQQPGNLSVPLGSVATLTASAVTDSTSPVGDENDPEYQWTNNYVIYQWTKNGVAIPGANSSSYSFGPVSPLDSSLTFVCQVRALGYVNNSLQIAWSNSLPATLTVTSPSGTPVYEPGFVLHEYYAANPSPAQIAAGTAGNPTWLMAEPAFEADVASLEVADNFSDQLVGFFIPPTTQAYTFYLNSDDDARLFLSTDSSSSSKRMIAQETAWSAPLNWGNSNAGNAAQVDSATFVDPTSGAMPGANGFTLQAGQKYFMQLVHHQGGGGTESCTTWVPFGAAAPAGGTLSVMRGAEIGTYVPRSTNVTFTTQPVNMTTNAYSPVTFTANGTTDSLVPVGNEHDWRTQFNNFMFFQWYVAGQPIAGATASAFTIPEVFPYQNGAPVYCTMRALGYSDALGNRLWATSSIATLNVITGAPPALTYSATYTNYATQQFLNYGYAPVTYLDLAFSAPVDPVALLNANNYVFSSGSGISSANITGITVNSNGYRQVELALNASPIPPLSVTVNGVIGLGGGAALTGTPTTNVNTVALTCLDIGTFGGQNTLSGNDPSLPTTVYVDGNGAYTVQAEGSDIWNSADGFNFLYEAKSGNFDVVVRQIDTTHVANWTKGGLMIRETLDASSRDWNIVNDPVTSDNIQAVDGSGFGANIVECNCRPTYGANSQSWETNTAPTPTYPNAWVRLTLQRMTNGATVQDIITAYSSTNGVIWTPLAQTDAATNGETATPLADPVYVGICTTAHDNDAANGIAGIYVDTADYANYNSQYVSTPPTLMIGRAGAGNVTVSWTPGVGTLYSSPALFGPAVDWQPVGTANPSTIPITGAAQYFRVVVSP